MTYDSFYKLSIKTTFQKLTYSSPNSTYKTYLNPTKTSLFGLEVRFRHIEDKLAEEKKSNIFYNIYNCIGLKSIINVRNSDKIRYFIINIIFTYFNSSNIYKNKTFFLNFQWLKLTNIKPKVNKNKTLMQGMPNRHALPEHLRPKPKQIIREIKVYSNIW